MKTTIIGDTTTRVITAEVQDVPDIDVTTYHRKPRIYRPDRIRLTLVNGSFDRVGVSGGLVLKSGAASDAVTESQTWYQGGLERDTMPEWVKTFIRETLSTSHHGS